MIWLTTNKDDVKINYKRLKGSSQRTMFLWQLN
jgi:hypothetical protein